jgi:hypothetical protein
MRIIVRSILFATGLLFAAVTANAQAYYSGYYYPGYTAYPGTVVAPSPTYTYPYYDNYVYPSYAGSYYYYSRPTPYNDPYVASRPYSDGAGPKAN